MRSLKSLTQPLLFLVLFNLLPQIQLRPVWVTASAFALVGFRIWLEFSHWRLPPRWTIWAAQGILVFAVWRTYQSFFGDEAGGTLLTLLLCLKTFELKTKRDYFICTALCILVLMSYLLLDQGLMISLFLLVDVVAIIGFLLALEEERWSWRKWRQVFWPSAGMALKCLPLVALMFILFPRFNTGFGHNADSKTKTGMSDSLHPGSVSHLIGSDELIFRATFLDGRIPQRSQLYWRGAVLDHSSGLNWDRSHRSGRKLMGRSTPPHPEVEIYLEPGSDRFLFSLENTQYLYFPNESIGRRVGTLAGGVYDLAEPLQTRERYQIQGRERAYEDLRPENYLQVEERPSAELRSFLRKFRNKRPGQVVSELLEHFRKDGYRYSLTPPPVRTLDDFLFKTKTGFCEHYAGVTATILRDLGIPARVVIGFQGGTPSFFDNYISVRGTDAHAWVEYFDQQSWHRMDPTGVIDPQRVTLGSEVYLQNNHSLMPVWLPSGWLKSYFRARAFMDEVEASWTGFLLRFDLARQKEIFAKLGMDEVLIRALLVFLLLSLGLFLAVLYFFEAQKPEPLSADEKLYRLLLARLKKWGVDKAHNEGPLTLLGKIQRVSPSLALQVEPILVPLIHSRFGRAPLSTSAVKALRLRLRDLRKG